MDATIKSQIQDLIIQDDLKAAIALLLQSIPKRKHEAAYQFSSRYLDLQKQIRLGLIEYEKEMVTKSQIRYGILEMMNALEGKSDISILVAGTGQYNLPSSVYLMAQSLGTQIAKNNWKLICGGWQGVDYVVAEAFSKEILAKGQPLSERLVQVVPENQMPQFRGGQVLEVKKGIKEWLESIKYADVVILVGGKGGTYEMFVYAHQEARPVIPIATTGGDAQRVFDKIISQWAYWENVAFKGVSLDDFKKLQHDIQNQKDAERLTDEVLGMVRAL